MPDVDVSLRPGEHVYVGRLAHGLVVGGRVRVGLDKAVVLDAVEGAGAREETRRVVLLVTDVVPHGEEHQREAVDRLAAEHDAAVEPVAEALTPVYVLVREVHAAGEGDLAVDDADLAVVAVVEGAG